MTSDRDRFSIGTLLPHYLAESLSPLNHKKRYLSILNMGDNRGILSWRSLVVSGLFAFVLKNYIDKRFMKRFQVSGEMDEG